MNLASAIRQTWQLLRWERHLSALLLSLRAGGQDQAAGLRGLGGPGRVTEGRDDQTG